MADVVAAHSALGAATDNSGGLASGGDAQLLLRIGVHIRVKVGAARAVRVLAVAAAVTALGVPEGAQAAARSWSAVGQLAASAGAFGPGNGILGLACPSASLCTAIVSNGEAVTFDPRSPAKHFAGRLEPACNGIHGACPVSLRAVACPSIVRCTAVDDAGRQITFGPAAPDSPVSIAVDDRTLLSVSCPSTQQCTAVDSGGVAVTFDPTSLNTRVRRLVDPGHVPYAIACSSVRQCTAVDNAGRAITFDPNASAGQWTAALDRPHPLNGIACPTDRQCTAVDTAGRQVTFDPEAPGRAATSVIDRGHYLWAVACPSANDCVAVDDAGRSLEGNPPRSRTWTFQPIAHAHALSTVACHAVTQCVTADGFGEAFVGIPPNDGVRLTSSHRVSLTDQWVTFTATVRPRPTGGKMMFLADGRSIARCGAVPVSPSRGTAPCRTRFDRPGTFSVQAVYTGDAVFTPSQSLPLAHTVKARWPH